MADYIQSNILCQAYLHIENPKVQDSQLPALRDELILFIERRSRFILYPEVSADVRFRAGSLVEYLTVAGSLWVVLKDYSKFREGVAALYGDVKRLADSMILEAQFTSQAKSIDVTRSEARTGVIGSLKTLVDALDNIKDSAGVVRVETLSRRLSSSLDDAIRLLNVLRDPRDLKLVAENLKDILFELPVAPTDPKMVRASKKSLDEYIAIIRKFKQVMEDYVSKIKA